MLAITFFYGAVLTLVVFLTLNVFRAGVTSIPGPWLAKFSNIYRLMLQYRGHYSYDILALHRKYGKYVRIGPDVVSIADAQVLDSIYGLKTNFPKSDWVKPAQTLHKGQVVPALLTTQDKTVHRELKRTIASAYSVTSLLGYEEAIGGIIQSFHKALEDRFISSGRPCPLHDWLQYYSYDIIGQITMSKPLGFIEAGEDIDGILEEIHDETAYRAFAAQMPIIDWIYRKNPIIRHFQKATHQVMIRAQAILNQRLEDGKTWAEDQHDFIYRFLEAKEKHPDVLGDRNMLGFVGSNLQAGSDTTAIALRTLVYHVYRNPAILQKLRAELDEHAHQQPMPFQDAYQLPYTWAVVREALRIHPPFAMLLERFVPAEGMELPDGTWLPPNTIVGMTGYTMHRDKDIYGPDADDFNPERWLQGKGEDEEAYKDRFREMNRCDLSFSAGTRACPGRHIADLQIFKLMPTFFRFLNIQFVNPQGWVLEQKFHSLQWGMDAHVTWREGFGMDSFNVATAEAIV